ncbi:hypothetical protein [Pseudooceanicola aestuarii]|uniref:hypothetical protein n=1 Tax=Pseudooceanicola aestuarii TaxID=2697319 RepID=UPI0013D5F658|nr:hypothetical protein [Pseudooceanicola aestuarii]
MLGALTTDRAGASEVQPIAPSGTAPRIDADSGMAAGRDARIQEDARIQKSETAARDGAAAKPRAPDEPVLMAQNASRAGSSGDTDPHHSYAPGHGASAPAPWAPEGAVPAASLAQDGSSGGGQGASSEEGVEDTAASSAGGSVAEATETTTAPALTSPQLKEDLPQVLAARIEQQVSQVSDLAAVTLPTLPGADIQLVGPVPDSADPMSDLGALLVDVPVPLRLPVDTVATVLPVAGASVQQATGTELPALPALPLPIGETFGAGQNTVVQIADPEIAANLLNPRDLTEQPITGVLSQIANIPETVLGADRDAAGSDFLTETFYEDGRSDTENVTPAALAAEDIAAQPFALSAEDTVELVTPDLAGISFIGQSIVDAVDTPYEPSALHVTSPFGMV